jgi:hypothetical protein
LEKLHDEELGDAGKIMREWASTHLHVPAWCERPAPGRNQGRGT